MIEPWPGCVAVLGSPSPKPLLSQLLTSMVMEPPDAIGDVDGVVCASGTLKSLQLAAAWAAPGARAMRAISSSHACGARMNDKRRAVARCVDER